MKEFWSMVQLLFTGIGGWLGYFLGGCDGLILALLLFVVADYITGIMCAIADKKLSSEVGFKGICRKVLIFMLVGIANVLDVQVIGNGSILRTAVIFFYLSNEGISLLENAGHLGLPIPEKLKKAWEIGFTDHPPRPPLIMELIRMAELDCMWKRRIAPGVLPVMLMIRERLPLNALLIRWNLILCMQIVRFW